MHIKMRTILGFSAAMAAMAVAPAYLAAQALPGPNAIYLQTAVPASGPPPGGPFFLSSAQAGLPVTGKPFSGTEQRHTLQVLGDGTHIERTETVQFYRDSEGRTRSEQTAGGNNIVTISDPVAGFIVTLNPADKTAHKMPLPPALPGAGAIKTVAIAGGSAGIATSVAPAGAIAGAQHVEIHAPGGAGFTTGPQAQSIMIIRNETDGKAPATEDLGTQMLNGVSAQGSRTTLTIPAGQIGNDRQLSVVSERWYSSDLQLTVRTVSNDPRFGESTYELTNIVQGAQDPSLFTIPPDYTVSQPQMMEFKGPAQK